MADVQILAAARREADRKWQLSQFADVCRTQLVPGPSEQFHLPVDAVAVAPAQIDSGQVAVGIAHQQRVAAVEEEIHGLLGKRSAKGQIAGGDDEIRRRLRYIVQHRFAGRQVSVDVRQDCYAHEKPESYSENARG